MALKVINYQCLCKAIGKHVSATHPSNFELTIANKLLNIIVLNIDILDVGLTLSVFGQDDACFAVFI